MSTKSFYRKALSFVLAMVMMFSVVAVFPQDVSAVEKPLGKNGGTVSFSDEEADAGVHVISFTAKADGYLQVELKSNTQKYNYAIGQMQLYDSTQSNALSPIFNYSTNYTEKGYYSEYYGVKKKKTYYIMILASGGVTVNAKFKKLTDKGGAKQKKACNIKKGKKGIEGVVAAGTTTAHWYKFTMTKNQKLNCTITSRCTGTLNYQVKGPGLLGGGTKSTVPSWAEKLVYTNGPIRSGTYYVQIKPATKQANGYYKIWWK